MRKNSKMEIQKGYSSFNNFLNRHSNVYFLVGYYISHFLTKTPVPRKVLNKPTKVTAGTPTLKKKSLYQRL